MLESRAIASQVRLSAPHGGCDRFDSLMNERLAKRVNLMKSSGDLDMGFVVVAP